MSDDAEIKTTDQGALAGTSDGASGEGPKWSNRPTVSFRKLQRKTIGQILVESQAITAEQLSTALEKQKESQGKIGEILVENDMVTEEDMLRALAYQLDLPYYSR